MIKINTYACSLKYKRLLKCGLIGRGVFHLLISIGLFLTATAFRLPQNTAPDIVRKFDQSFVVESQVELYRTVEVDMDGNVDTGEMLIMYQYAEDGVYGIFRILSSKKNAGYINLTIQKKGQKPKIFLYDPTHKKVSEIKGQDMKQSFGQTAWNLEDTIDDDKEEWVHKIIGRGYYDGHDCNIIEGHFANTELQSQSAYKKRLLYLTRDDGRLIQSLVYDHDDRLLKTVRASEHENVIEHGPPQIRAKRLEITHHLKRTITVLVSLKSRYNLPLPKGLFSKEYLISWGEETDREILSLLDEE